MPNKPIHDTVKKFKSSDVRTAMIYWRDEIPEDYHGKDVIIGKWLGELFHTLTDQYYTQSTRSQYYFPDVKPEGGFDKHICPGHWQGYRWAIQNFTNPGDMVLDPTCGTGTAVVESINHGRNAIGIELEFSEITKRTIQTQYDRADKIGNVVPLGNGTIINGDARDLNELLHEKGFIGEEIFDLVINGTPYPVLGSAQSDAPERGYTSAGKGASITYGKSKNVGVLKGQKYWDTVLAIYTSAINKLKPGGKFITIIKDPTQNKKPYLLHKMIADMLIEHLPVKPYGTFVHKHLPYTLFMNTYPKQHPDAQQIPLYQTGTVLEKY